MAKELEPYFTHNDDDDGQERLRNPPEMIAVRNRGHEHKHTEHDPDHDDSDHVPHGIWAWLKKHVSAWWEKHVLAWLKKHFGGMRPALEWAVQYAPCVLLLLTAPLLTESIAYPPGESGAPRALSYYVVLLFTAVPMLAAAFQLRGRRAHLLFRLAAPLLPALAFWALHCTAALGSMPKVLSIQLILLALCVGVPLIYWGILLFRHRTEPPQRNLKDLHEKYVVSDDGLHERYQVYDLDESNNKLRKLPPEQSQKVLAFGVPWAACVMLVFAIAGAAIGQRAAADAAATTNWQLMYHVNEPFIAQLGAGHWPKGVGSGKERDAALQALLDVECVKLGLPQLKIDDKEVIQAGKGDDSIRAARHTKDSQVVERVDAVCYVAYRIFLDGNPGTEALENDVKERAAQEYYSGDQEHRAAYYIGLIDDYWANDMANVQE